VPDDRVHEKPAERFARAERLIPVDPRSPKRRERVESRQVPRDGYVSVEANRYPGHASDQGWQAPGMRSADDL
jgi:hypothetical protein